MTDLTEYKIKDKLTGKLVAVRDTDELADWLYEHTATKNTHLTERTDHLVRSLDSGTDDEVRWAAAACELTFEKVKKKRGRKK